MTVSTSESAFDGDIAEKLLSQADQDTLTVALGDLRQKVLAQVDSSNKLRPGRVFRYAERSVLCLYQRLTRTCFDTFPVCSQREAIYGPLPEILYRDAVVAENELYGEAENDWLEWPLTASDGQAAALICLIADGKVGFPSLQKGVLQNREALEPDFCRRSHSMSARSMSQL